MGSLRIINPYPRRVEDKNRAAMRYLGRPLWSFLARASVGWISRSHQRYGLFDSIEIETVNRCNGSCTFCPVNAKADPRPLARMTEDLFRKIIDELAGLGYHGSISFYSNNEPYLDKYLPARISYARQRCPSAILRVCTNGTALNWDRFVRTLEAGVDVLHIDNYSDALRLHDNIREIADRLSHLEPGTYRADVKIELRLENEVLTNRGGSAPNKNAATDDGYLNYRGIGCALPFRQLVVRPTGKISLCCNDALGQVTLGDANAQSLQAIWNGPEYRLLRASLLATGRAGLSVCETCDVFMPRFEFHKVKARARRARSRD